MDAQERRKELDIKFRKKFSRKFAKEMKRIEITPADIEKKCGYHSAQINYWVRGLRVPSVRNLSMIYKKFPELDLDTLLK